MTKGKEQTRPFEKVGSSSYRGNNPTSCHIIEFYKVIEGPYHNQLVFFQERIDGNNVTGYIANITNLTASDFEKNRSFIRISGAEEHIINKATREETLKRLEEIVKNSGGKLIKLNHTNKISIE